MEKINIREKERDLSFKQLWLKDQFEKIRSNPELDSYSNQDLKEYLLKKYETRRLVER